MGLFLQKQLTAKSPGLFFQKSSTTDFWLGSKYSSCQYCQRKYPFKRHFPSFVKLFESFSLETLKYWVGVQQGQSYLMERRCLFSLGWPPFKWFCHDKNALWERCLTLTSFAPHLFLLGWLKLDLALLLDQLRLT